MEVRALNPLAVQGSTVYMCTYIHKHINICIYTYVFTHIHIYITHIHPVGSISLENIDQKCDHSVKKRLIMNVEKCSTKLISHAQPSLFLKLLDSMDNVNECLKP